MAGFKHGTAAKVYLADRDISPFLESVSLDLERDMVDVRVLCSQAVDRIIGWKGTTLGLEGVYDAASYEAAIWDLIDGAVGSIAIVLLGGADFGDTGYMAEALVSSEQINAGNDAIKMPSQAFGLGRLRRGVVLHAMGEETSSGNGTTLDQLASSAAGGAAYLVCTEIDPGASLTVKVQDSADGLAWDDMATFAVDDPISSIGEVDGAVDRYARTIWTLGGAGGATFFVGWGRD